MCRRPGNGSIQPGIVLIALSGMLLLSSPHVRGQDGYEPRADASCETDSARSHRSGRRVAGDLPESGQETGQGEGEPSMSRESRRRILIGRSSR
jgi:hypothetical protein